MLMQLVQPQHPNRALAISWLKTGCFESHIHIASIFLPDTGTQKFATPCLVGTCSMNEGATATNDKLPIAFANWQV